MFHAHSYQLMEFILGIVYAFIINSTPRSTSPPDSSCVVLLPIWWQFFECLPVCDLQQEEFYLQLKMLQESRDKFERHLISANIGCQYMKNNKPTLKYYS